ncbi:SecC motif-containing protein [Janibacter hoylei PVAS-1]|uniref:SecC motif-containing protein n=1 Tax=Janibacter hoylei PVAS-1 TaxID=1210046 RepID=K1DZ20_9MICO|nr:SecC motif-containing protein [Janibacter hoylei PVAS-1]
MSADPCPCGTGSPFASCCGPLLASEGQAETAEQLMRSRYTAHVYGNAEHLGAPGTAGPGPPRCTSTTPAGWGWRSARWSPAAPTTPPASSTSSPGTKGASSPSGASSPDVAADGSTRRRSRDRGPVRRRRAHRDDHARRT